MPKPARDPGQPVPGVFKVRLVKGGPYVPARIIEKDGLWQAEINGELVGTPEADPFRAEGVDRIWHYGVDSTVTERSYLLALKAWAAKNRPDHPLLHPLRPIDPAQLAPLTS